MRKNSNSDPWKVFEPERVATLTTPPLKRPNSAGTLSASTVNSWMSSTIGKNATWPGSGCSAEMPS